MIIFHLKPEANALFTILGRWSLSNGGVTYKFKNGHSVTGYGSLSNGGSVGVKYTIPFGRKRRSFDDELKLGAIVKNETDTLVSMNPKPLSFKDEMESRKDEQEAPEESSILKDVIELENQDEDKCNKCLEIKSFKVNDKDVENKTLTSNDFVMVVKLIEENMSAVKFDARIKFEVIEIVKSPIDSVASGQTFTIKAQMATCPCLTSLDPGFYVVTGTMNEENQLVLSNVLMEFEN